MTLKLTDTLSKAERSQRMSLIRSKGTKAEVAVRRMVTELGFRYRLHRKDIAGCPDLAFIRQKKVIFVNGCFWHQHKNCGLGRTPKSNLTYWIPKLRGNVERDKAVRKQLRKNRWKVMTVWQCQLKDSCRLKARLGRFLKYKQHSGET